MKFEIRDHKDLVQKTIPHFEKFPLISAKQNDKEELIEALKIKI